ncbi:hypothetical protein FTV88_1340 [Heliorestis convoluta]|uniref:Uncharacterized protein n=1 Tax=Heliorestis convoluta TaxID=356322 RepID=A0A5Q2MY00_9FIRM|nr:hypothetical protein FTV88_1340 [Heliorestis convoluta]
MIEFSLQFVGKHQQNNLLIHGSSKRVKITLFSLQNPFGNQKLFLVATIFLTS